MKALSDRLSECLRLRRELNALGIDAVGGEALGPMYAAMNDFVKTGTSYSDEVALKQIGKRLVYKLTSVESIASDIVIKAL
jgi:hypothetical protein